MSKTEFSPCMKVQQNKEKVQWACWSGSVAMHSVICSIKCVLLSETPDLLLYGLWVVQHHCSA